MENKTIAYIGSFHNLWDEEGIARSFEKLGYRIFRFSEKAFDTDNFLHQVDIIKPDFVVFAKLKIPTANIVVRELKRRKIKTVCWVWDLYFGLNREFFVGRLPMFKADYVFSPDGGNDEKFKERGVNHYLLRQAIYDEYCYKGKFRKEYNYDVVFVGCENMQWHYRTELCNFLKKNYKSFKWFGRNNTLEIRGHELNDLYASAKIVIGDSVYSPYYWSNRLYETLGRGGFMIFLEIEGLDREYIPYKHYIPYKMEDFKGLKEKIDYYLKNKKGRKKISNEALKYTQKHHTLIQRCQELIKIIS